MNFLKRVLSTVTGIFVFIGLCLFLLIIIGVAFGGGDDDKVKVAENSVLALDLSSPLADYKGQFDYGEFDELLKGSVKYNDLFDVIHAIDYAATDDKIKGIKIQNNFLQAGIAQTKALRDALLRFKKSGKFILAYGDIISKKTII